MRIRDTDRTNDGRGYFTFAFQDEGRSWRVDIEEAPIYRDSSLHLTHRLPSPTAATGYKICFDRPEVVTTLDKAKTFSETWAEAIWEWNTTGCRINGF